MVDKLFGWVSRKVLVQAVAAGVLVLLNALAPHVTELDVPSGVKAALVVVVPMAIAWIKKETNPPASAFAAVK